jgi:hypothetical protein
MTTMMCWRFSIIIAVAKVEIYFIITILLMAVHLLISFSILFGIPSMVLHLGFTGSIDDSWLSSDIRRRLARFWSFLLFIPVSPLEYVKRVP